MKTEEDFGYLHSGNSNVTCAWLAWLEYFYVEADFGPADSDVRDMMYESFKQETGYVIDEMESAV